MVRTAADRWKRVKRAPLDLLKAAAAQPLRVDPELILQLEGLEIGDSIHASSVTLPGGVEFVISDRDFTIATIAAPTIMVEETTENEEAEEGGEAPAGEDGAEASGDAEGSDDGGDNG